MYKIFYALTEYLVFLAAFHTCNHLPQRVGNALKNPVLYYDRDAIVAHDAVQVVAFHPGPGPCGDKQAAF
jgi:hypothetical protein